jgi:hypothetical protein
MHVGAAAVGRVYTALRIEGFERRAERGDVVVVYGAAVHCLHHDVCGVVRRSGRASIRAGAAGRLDLRSGLRRYHRGGSEALPAHGDTL